MRNERAVLGGGVLCLCGWPCVRVWMHACVPWCFFRLCAAQTERHKKEYNPSRPDCSWAAVPASESHAPLRLLFCSVLSDRQPHLDIQDHVSMRRCLCCSAFSRLHIVRESSSCSCLAQQQRKGWGMTEKDRSQDFFFFFSPLLFLITEGGGRGVHLRFWFSCLLASSVWLWPPHLLSISTHFVSSLFFTVSVYKQPLICSQFKGLRDSNVKQVLQQSDQIHCWCLNCISGLN